MQENRYEIVWCFCFVFPNFQSSYFGVRESLYVCVYLIRIELHVSIFEMISNDKSRMKAKNEEVKKNYR